jgi:pilus assembly protein CpaE
VEVHLKRARAAALVIEALATKPAKAAGCTIACFSLRGGSGVSTLASSLAVALAQIWSRPCLLLDLVLAGGHAALLMNVPSKVTWAGLARVEPANYDPVFVEQHLVSHASGVRVLAAPIRVQDGDLVAAAHVTGVLDFVQTSYDYIVADLPHDFRDTTMAVLDRATMILMPFAPELASLRSVAAALEAFEALDYPAERLPRTKHGASGRIDRGTSQLEAVGRLGSPADGRDAADAPADNPTRRAENLLDLCSPAACRLIG